jgi:adenine phosphoribosyltransferase
MENPLDPRVDTLRARVRDIPDFPKPGILFRDLTPLLSDGATFRLCIDLLAEEARRERPDLVVGIESRGFIFGAALADRIGAGFVPVRKPGKLPWRRMSESYALEYGTDALELHEDAVAGRRCLLVDDLLATGGTAAAAGRLVERLSGELCGYLFVVELDALGGRQQLVRTVHSLVHY